jgi:hypothetical protein
MALTLPRDAAQIDFSAAAPAQPIGAFRHDEDESGLFEQGLDQ